MVSFSQDRYQITLSLRWHWKVHTHTFKEVLPCAGSLSLRSESFPLCLLRWRRLLFRSFSLALRFSSFNSNRLNSSFILLSSSCLLSLSNSLLSPLSLSSWLLLRRLSSYNSRSTRNVLYIYIFTSMP